MDNPQSNFAKAVLFLVGWPSLGLAPLFGQNESPKEPSGPAPQIQIHESTHNFGRLLAGAKFKHEFTFENAGDADLVISKIVPSCGCTTLMEWSRKIPPGGKGMIPLEFNSTGMLGAKNHSIAVYSNDPDRPISVLVVEGVVWRHVEVHPSMALIQMPPNGGQKFSTSLRIVNQMKEPLTLQAPVSSVPQFKARIEEVAAGKEFYLVVDTVQPLPGGDIQGMITVATSSKEVPQLKIGVLAIAQPEIMVSPTQLFLPAVPPDFPEPYKISVRNQSAEPITLSDPSCDLPGATVVVNEINPGRDFELAMKVPDDQKAIPGALFFITAKTSLPSQPEINIQVAFANQLTLPPESK